jgi:hypothetical protein
MARNVNIEISLPQWFLPEEGFEIDPESGIKQINWTRNDKSVSLSLNDLHMGKLLVFTSNREARKSCQTDFVQIIKTEE